MDLIDRSKIRWVSVPVTDETGTTARFMVAFKEEVDALPTTNAESAIHAHWEKYEVINHDICICSNCHNYWIAAEDKRSCLYCPSCGAIMDEEE